eukprot:symbB.v1.2.018035.t1/scaffold1423.1/size119681/4
MARSAQQSKPRKRKATVDAAKTRPNSLKGVSMIKTKDGHRRYFARAIISGIAISSRCVRSREEAQVLRAQLEQVSLLHRGEKHDSQLELAFDKFQEHMWLFRATVDARRFLGKTLSSRQTEPTLAKSVEDGIRRCQSEGTFLTTAPTRHQTLIADPKFLDELRRLKDAQRKVVPTSPVAKPKISLDAVEVSAQLPEDGWP